MFTLHYLTEIFLISFDFNYIFGLIGVFRMNLIFSSAPNSSFSHQTSKDFFNQNQKDVLESPLYVSAWPYPACY
jgi:hypothetical protein